MPTADFKVKTWANTLHPSYLMIGPVEVKIDEPLNVGCFTLPPDFHLEEPSHVTTVLDCIVLCHTQGFHVAAVKS